MNGGWWQYAGVFVGSSLLSLILTPLAMKFAVSQDVLDVPGGHKSHSSPVPYLGGVAIVLAFSVIVGTAAIADSSTRGDSELVKVLGIAVGLSVIGLIDDLRGLPSLLRLGIEIGSGVLLHVLDVGVKFTGSTTLDLLVTVVWVVGLTTAEPPSSGRASGTPSAGIATPSAAIRARSA